MIVSEKVELASSVALLLVFIFGWPLIELFPLSTAGRFLSLLFVTIVGAGSIYILIFAKTEEDKPKDLTKWAVDLLERLDEDELKELLRTAALIADPLSQELIKKAATEEVGILEEKVK